MELTVPASEANQIGHIRRRHFAKSNKEYGGIIQAPPVERSLDDLPSHTIPGLTIAQVVQIRKLINARKVDNETWLQSHAFSIVLLTLLLVFAGVAWKRINTLEASLMGKTIDIGFEVALTITENNPKLVGEDQIAGLLHLVDRQIYQTFERDISVRLGNLISTSSVTSENLLSMAREMLQKQQYLRAMTLSKVSHQLFLKETNSPDDVAKMTGLIVALVSATVRPMLQADDMSRNAAIVNGVKYMERLLNDLRSLTDVTHSVKALTIGRCSVDLVHTMVEIGEYQKALQLAEDGVTIMENEFLEEVSKYRYYGYLLNNQGTAYESKKDFAKAAISYTKALEAKVKAVDYENEEIKMADLDMTKENIKRAQANLV